MKRRIIGLLAAFLAGAPAARIHAADTSEELVAGSGFEQSFQAALASASVFPSAPSPVLESLQLEVPAEPPKPKWFWVALGGTVAIAGSAWSAYSEDPRFPFHVTKEGWFGRNTYVGGADKASHFVSYYAVQRMVDEYNRAFHVPADQAALLATGESILAGLMTEIGDGTNKFGFSFEDLAADTLGALSGLAIVHYGLNDLIGFRVGLVPAPKPPRAGLGRDYSGELYTADLKISGLGQRACFNPGPARFLLFSVSYGSKGYPYAEPEVRQRQIGLEIGINFGAVMEALHVPKNKWWGKCLYLLFDIVRFPYTAIGWRYDLNNKHWYGPDIGDTWPNPGY